MPAPSPVLPSASTAPRCHTAFSASMPACTTSRARLAVERGDQADAAGVMLGQVDDARAFVQRARDPRAKDATKSEPDSICDHGALHSAAHAPRRVLAPAPAM